MWFVLLGIALTLVATGGWYFRRRVLQALETLGVQRRYRRVVGWAIPWLLYGYPLLAIAVVATTSALGRETRASAPSGIGEWLLVYPFWWAVLVMLQTVPYLLAMDLATLFARRRLGRDRTRRYRTIGCLAVIAVFSVYTPARILLERGDLQVLHYDVGQDESAEPLRIVFFADLQQDGHTDRERAAEVVAAINDQDPDLVLVGGDWINTGAEHIEAAAASAGALEAPLGVHSVRGDHEHFAYHDQDRSLRRVSSALEDHGVEMLHNQLRFIEHRGARIAIVFLSYNYMYRTPEPEIRDLIRRAREADYSILVTHQFDSALGDIIADQIDLALVAHTHGGQVNPVVGLVHVPIARVETPYIAGRYQLGSTTIIATSGIGFSIAPFRYAAPASIEVIDLHP